MFYVCMITSVCAVVVLVVVVVVVVVVVGGEYCIALCCIEENFVNSNLRDNHNM